MFDEFQNNLFVQSCAQCFLKENFLEINHFKLKLQKWQKMIYLIMSDF